MKKTTSDTSGLTKVNTAVFIAVVGMHLAIAGALVTMQMPEQKLQKPEEVKPVEIQLLSLAAAEIEPQPEPAAEPVQKARVQPTTPIAQPKPEPKTKPEPQLKPEPKTEPKPESKPKAEPKPKPRVEPKPKPKVEPKVEPAPKINSKVQEQVAREQAAREQAAKEQAAREQAAREQAAREQAAREQAAREQAAREQAAREQAAREQAAREQAAREQAEKEKIAASNQPQNFTASEVRWKRAPNLVVPPRVLKRSNPGDVYNVTLELIVDKQGNITDIKISKSSKNDDIDKAAIQQVKRGKLHPFKKNGVPVVSRVKVPFGYEIN